jgi:hypothetical protein
MADVGLNYDIVTLQGYQALQRRLSAIDPKGALGPPFMRQLGLQANREQISLLYHQVTRRTGFAGRTITTEGVTATQAATVARSYAVYLDRGTRPHVIRPNKAKVLAWAASGSGRRATGATRKGYKGAMVFARAVHHPGTKPYPFMVPGAERAVAQSGLADKIVAAWNAA